MRTLNEIRDEEIDANAEGIAWSIIEAFEKGHAREGLNKLMATMVGDLNPPESDRGKLALSVLQRLQDADLIVVE